MRISQLCLKNVFVEQLLVSFRRYALLHTVVKSEAPYMYVCIYLIWYSSRFLPFLLTTFQIVQTLCFQISSKVIPFFDNIIQYIFDRRNVVHNCILITYIFILCIDFLLRQCYCVMAKSFRAILATLSILQERLLRYIFINRI